jgi:Domain of unknown function (DUF4266)
MWLKEISRGLFWRCPVLLCSALWLSGCVTVTPVAPWQKGTLAKPEMGMEAEPLERVLREHIYTSKEAAAGGTAVGGGGCGCN